MVILTNGSKQQLSEIKNRYHSIDILNEAISDLIGHKGMSLADKYAQIDSFLERKEGFVLNLVGFASDYHMDGCKKYFKKYLDLCRDEISAIKGRNMGAFIDIWITDAEDFVKIKRLVESMK